MPISKFGIFGVLAVAAIAILAVVQHHSEMELLDKNQLLQKQVAKLNRISTENERLSNLVAQAKAAQAGANEQFQELVKLRAEMAHLSNEKQDSTRSNQEKAIQAATDQARELGALRTDVKGLTDVIGKLRNEIRDLHALASAPAPEGAGAPAASSASDAAPANTGPSVAGENAPVAIRMIDTHADTFPDKLKRSVSAQDGESFQEVFGRFLQVNGVDVTGIVGLVYDERTGRVIIRAPQPTLDAVERVTLALDRTQ
jgi:predicted metal-dependent hydrolase